MSKVEPGLLYTRSHEWVRVEQGVATLGITDHAQDQLGDVVFVELPEVGARVTAGKPFGVVESVKAVGDLYSPVDGEIIEINDVIVDAPEKINEDSFGEGWCVKVTLDDPETAVNGMMSADEYQAFLDAEEH